MSQSILGFVMARDEWPLVGLAVIHALSVGIDRIVVLDHASDDNTANGLAHLCAGWPDQLTYLRLEDDLFMQRSTTAVVAELVEAWGYDWFYVFDADEFMLTPSGNSLRQTLAEVPLSADSVQYSIAQWVAPHDLDDLNYSDYGRVTHRAIPSVFTRISGETLGEEIERGHMNYFDVPFPPKVIVRGALAHALLDGAHNIRVLDSRKQVILDPSALMVAHLPLRSRRYLPNKARQGQFLVTAGFPKQHGWQSQMIYRMAATSSLELFWRNHSIWDAREESQSSPQSIPVTQVDLSLSSALQSAAEDLQAVTSHNAQVLAFGLAKTRPDATEVSLFKAAKAVERQLLQVDSALAERDSALAERDSALAERDSALAERDIIRGSRIWRITKLYRWFRSI